MVEGVGEDFIPTNVDLSLLDDALRLKIQRPSDGKGVTSERGHISRFIQRDPHRRSN